MTQRSLALHQHRATNCSHPRPAQHATPYLILGVPHHALGHLSPYLGRVSREYGLHEGAAERLSIWCHVAAAAVSEAFRVSSEGHDTHARGKRLMFSFEGMPAPVLPDIFYDP